MICRAAGAPLSLAAAIALASCSGASHLPAAPLVPAKTVQVGLSIAIPLPKVASNARRPLFVSAGTVSGGIALGPNTTNITQAFDLSAGSPSCATAGGVRTCTVTVDLPIGTDQITLSTFDGPLASGRPTGHQLATVSVTQTILEGKLNTVVMSLLGLPARATISALAPITSTGQPVSAPLVVTVFDASGNQISGTDAFAQPIAFDIQSAFGSGVQITVNGGPPTMTKPTDSVALVYAGRDGSGQHMIRASTNFGNTTLGSSALTILPGFRMAQQISTNLTNADLVQRYDNRDIWLTEPAAHKIASLSASGAFVEYPVASGKEPRHITYTGFPSSGAPLFVTELPDTIGRVALNGTISETQVPTANAGLGGIAWNGATFTLWFAEAAGNIATSNFSGTITEYPTGIPGSAPSAVAGGSWFTDAGKNAIGLMRPDHTVVEFPVPTANAAPSAIVAQSTNDTWFAESNAPNLGHIDNFTHVIVEYPAGDAIVSLVPAATDGFTTLWAVLRNGTVEYFNAQSGTFTVVTNTLPAGGSFVAATIGTNNNVWLLRSGASLSELDELIY